MLLGPPSNFLGAYLRFQILEDLHLSSLDKLSLAYHKLCLWGSPPKVASNWFQIKERTLATAVISLVNPIGIAIGTYLSPAIVKEADDIPLLLGIQASCDGVL